MEVVFKYCAGLDVHKQIIVACVLLSNSEGAQRLIRKFATTMAGLEALDAWVAGLGVTHVAMESTGVYPGLAVQGRLEAGVQCAVSRLCGLDCQCSRSETSARPQDRCVRCGVALQADERWSVEAQLHSGSRTT